MKFKTKNILFKDSDLDKFTENVLFRFIFYPIALVFFIICFPIAYAMKCEATNQMNGTKGGY